MFLLTNDDGVTAEGLTALRHTVTLAFPEIPVVTIAPSGQRSMIGHRVTTDAPLELVRLSEDVYTIDGTPADCVRIGLFAFSQRPLGVFAGINHGGNLGQDIPISGTVAAIREAAYHGVPAIAVSHYLRREVPLSWERASELTTKALRTIATASAGNVEPWDGWYSINLPHLDPNADLESVDCVTTRPEPAPLPVNFAPAQDGHSIADDLPVGKSCLLQYSADYSSRPATGPASDVAACFGGAISITDLGASPTGW